MGWAHLELDLDSFKIVGYNILPSFFQSVVKWAGLGPVYMLKGWTHLATYLTKCGAYILQMGWAWASLSGLSLGLGLSIVSEN